MLLNFSPYYFQREIIFRIDAESTHGLEEQAAERAATRAQLFIGQGRGNVEGLELCACEK
jgi:hypothetical protein